MIWMSGHLKLTLRLLALKASEIGSDRLDEEEANYVVEYGGFLVEGPRRSTEKPRSINLSHSALAGSNMK